MAGSQLKQLKEALRAKGLVGQTNVKKKSKTSKRTPSETRRNDKEQVINEIRSQFNQFDQRLNRTKRDVSVIQGGKFVKAGSKQHNDATRSKSNVQKNMKMQYDLEKRSHGKNSAIVDRRFGESNKHLSAEEKMLERFTREKQSQSKKRGLYSIESEDEYDEDEGLTLTHGGKVLSLEDEDDAIGDGSATRFVDEDQLEDEADQPQRKKSKKEVMKEIIAKSKFYKHQRQVEFQKTQDNIEDLDEEFGDIMQEIANIKNPAKPKFSTKTEEEKEYDSKVRELTYDRRSVPADRTKTDEELKKEHDDRMKKLEADRLKRMSGMEIEDDRNAEGDDLDDEFWAGSDDNEEDGFTIKDSENEEEDEEEDEDDDNDDENPNSKPIGRVSVKKQPQIIIPASHEDFLASLKDIDTTRHPAYVNKIIEIYRPNLAEGNKDKMNTFVGILFEHILYLSEDDSNTATIEKLSAILKKLAESYNQVLVETIRQEINFIQERVLDNSGLILKRDYVFFIIIGYLFSTSDHYHLIVTPCLIVMAETLTTLIYQPKASLAHITQGIFISDILLNYQRFSKRYIPEIVNFIEKALLILSPEPTGISPSALLLSTNSIIDTQLNLSKSFKPEEIFKTTDIQFSIGDLINKSNQEADNAFKFQLLIKLISLVEKSVNLWKEKTNLIEVLNSDIIILKHFIKYYATQLPFLVDLIARLTKIRTNLSNERIPLVLQHHRAIPIATYAPKFEENFNPDKKSYDSNVERQEVSKMKNQLKKERKAALKDIRQESRFVANEQIEEKKQMYDQYHKKMANIVNTIATTEGAEKNEYEREKKLRKSKK
ncbi:putative nucleolar complex protein 14 [Scheffersomyces amazonensis]|uniref:putative nucleolar complex protein 14 n=1 Tax=Scheffersomyces amazonensis TaxID=1078765 RepID=UPI00315CA17B